ncbi:3-dehydroquinate synthase [Anoxybacillus sp. LAT_35]|uniref:3-dehydroquinate synthase n=1 Tax=Anoxybacillus flavithermus NBRC 109594 TaxID=1315967 RepID=R4FZS9_9BACL|nr:MULTISPECIES: 3-dehydroquinate synthase [Anoxybacillus]MCG5024500.1 3-dehydroquinate synthase [Anoxybacillus flavithermus]MCG6198516.1 3-dehydroquinate synthase [Anoxybacillus sp. LAT_38]MCG3083433.1 3-dehydroquinate synthase [Anoxybacillus sp. LAT27]MCG6172129.1 3-dehydroquinate synthase [Anoxybacillus sp. LAT_11]MCG6174454.1 3-dehydroquinate synthase [Anoxybacillus sp. LAT_31]
MMKRIHIDTPSKRYEVVIGNELLHMIDRVIDRVCPHVTAVLIITDETVASLYLDDVKKTLHQTYDRVYTHIIPSGEEAKSFEQFYACHTAALTNHLDRHSLIVALGGGVVGDLAGFVAATYMRGIRFIQVPTTLLAHDSAVGGKTAINHPLGKNMIGAFYQPELVFYDISLLHTLPEREMRSGFAEIMKHSLIYDRAFFGWLQANVQQLDDLRGDRLQYAIQRGIEIKAAIVAKDEKEQGVRAYLNFGHTLGHALESELGYGVMTHGDAVALGMLFAIFVSERFYNQPLFYSSFRTLFHRYGFPTSLPSHVSPERLLDKMKKDKKAKDQTVRMVLMKEIGTVCVEQISDEQLLRWLYAFAEEGRGKCDSSDSRGNDGK